MQYTLGTQAITFRGDHHFIAPSADVIGEVILENNTSVWFNAVIRGDNEPIVIGKSSNVQDGTVLHTDPGAPLTLGQFVTVGHMAVLHGCTVGDNTLIGIKAVVLNHAMIGRNCLIGANTLITEGKEIPDNSLVLGSPGKVVRTVTDEEIAHIRTNAENYVAKFQRYLRELRAE
ncbi:MAG: gamma carbonic anhydrase family protein [Pseudomonadota bacterium]